MIQLNIVKLLVFVISGVFFLWFVSKAKSSWLNSDCITVHPEVAGGPYFGSLLWAASALFETYPARVLVIFQMLEWPSNCVLVLCSSTADVRLELSRSHVVQVEACLQVKRAQRKLTSFFQFMGKSFPLTTINYCWNSGHQCTDACSPWGDDQDWSCPPRARSSCVVTRAPLYPFRQLSKLGSTCLASDRGWDIGQECF